MALQTWAEHENRREPRADSVWLRLAVGLWCAMSWAITLCSVIAILKRF